MIAARVVFAVADDLVRPARVREVAASGMPIAHALTPDRDVPDTVEVLKAEGIEIRVTRFLYA